MPIKLKSILIVADNNSSIIVEVKKNPVRVNCINRIFPAIHEHKPDGIILDHDFLGNDMEKILRRLMSNPFYRGIKISCYKSKPHTRVDGLLKALGVQQFIYAPEQQQPVATPEKTLTGVLKSFSVGKLALRFIH
ncbi:MAG: hypothetical protein ABI367_10030 [Mucilaginibacter sp.]